MLDIMCPPTPRVTMSSRKCLLVGDGGTGKTSFIKRLKTGEFVTTYSATLGYEINKIAVRPSPGSSEEFILDVWDVSGQTSSGDLLKEILIGADCAIIVFDVTSRVTFNNVAVWYREILRACGPKIPVVIVGNKIDVPARKIKTETMLRKFSTDVKYYDISVKTMFNIYEPMLWIAGKLLCISHGETNSGVLKNESEASALQSAEKEMEIDSEINSVQSGRSNRLKTQRNLSASSTNGSSKNRNSPKRVNAKQGKKKTK